MEQLLNSLIRVGIVNQVDAQTCSAIVEFEDQDNVITSKLPILVRGSAKNKDYWLPAENEIVLCIFLPIGLADGFILGSFYNDEDTPPTTNANISMKQFSDGTKISYDVVKKILSIDAVGDIIIKCQNANIEAKSIVANADTMSVSAANITLAGNVSLGGAGSENTGEALVKSSATVTLNPDCITSDGKPVTGTAKIVGFTTKVTAI